MADGSVEFEIRADNSDVSNKITDTTNKLKSAAGQWESSTQAASNSSSMFAGVLQGVGQALTGAIVSAAQNAGKAVVQFGKECIAAASSLEETKNVVDTVFGDGASQIYRWAEAAQSAFGLTQTQALRYTSTLGAMMKSSGLAQNEITEMSTALAGLAADMASFYNMDFDTAFDKIRSGISGETEPLKQLGINLSVANLEAFALAQGIKKAYSEMSQAEQVALRYQYIMQATADAQGDFARTADGYANSARRIETAWESIKTAIGSTLLDFVAPLQAALADMLESLTAKPERTVFDEINDIEVDYAAEVKKITETHEKARALVTILEELHQSAQLNTVSTGMSDLIASLAGQIPGLYDELQNKNPTEQIAALAVALSEGSDVSITSWVTALKGYDSFAGALQDAMNADDPSGAIHHLAETLSESTGISVDDWVEILNTFAGALKTSNIKKDADETSGSIGELVSALTTSIPGLYSAIQGKDPSAQISALASALAEGSNVSTNGWVTALNQYESFAGALKQAMDADDPTAAIHDLAVELSEGSSIPVSGWEEILNTFAGALNTSDITSKANGAKDAVSGMADTFEASVTKLSEALGKANGLKTTQWEEVFTSFDSYKSVFFAALSENDPIPKLTALAKVLAGQPDSGLDPKQWQTALTTLATYLTEADANLSTEAIVQKLSELVGVIDGTGNISLADALKKFETDAGGVQSTNVDAWSAVLGTFSANFGGFKNALNDYNSSSTDKIKDLAAALSGINGSEEKVGAWKTLIELLGTDIPGLASALDMSDEEVTGWLNGMTDILNNIDPDNVTAFDDLMKTLTTAGKMEGLSTINGAASDAAAGLGEAADAMGSVYYASQEELAVLKQLVTMFPELSSVINTTTGEVKGGYEAILKFLDISEQAALKLAAQKKIEAELDALAQQKSYVTEWRVQVMLDDAGIAKATDKIERYRAVLEKYRTTFDENQYATSSTAGAAVSITGFEKEGIRTLADLETAYNNAMNAQVQYTAEKEELTAKIAEEQEAIDAVTQKIHEEAEALGVNATTSTEAAEAAEKYAQSQKEAAAAIKELGDQVQSIINYQESARKSALSSLDQVVSGLKALDTASEEYRKTISANTMQKNLQDQLKFLEEYSSLLDTLKDKGVSDDIIAAIADGSVESMQYMRGLATATESEIQALNEKYGQVNDKKLTLADKIAAERLAVDKEYQAMIDKAVEMAQAMDQSATAGEGAAATIGAVVAALASGYSELDAQVAAINALLAQIGQVGAFTVGSSLGTIGHTGGHAVGHDGAHYVPGYAMGLDYVPYNGFLAELHEGESILTPDEAAIWRNFAGVDSNDGQMAFDYDLLTASITGGMPKNNGNVYLNGEIVGRVISREMGNSYRKLERSGWRG